MDISNKVAVVTGGASGLGEATVRAYVAKGGKVAIFDMNAERGNAIVAELGEDKVAFFNVNVADEESVQNAVNAVMDKFGAIHICNNYAGIGSAAKTLSKNGPFPFAEYTKIINVNLVGTFNVARLVAEQIAKNEPYDGANARGVIINTASVAAYEGQVGQLAYSASKGGVVGMTLPMARDLASYGIRVNTIVPGLIHTPLFESLPEAAYKSLEQSVVNPQRLGRPEEIAHLSVMIAENEYMNGECIRLDGAIRMQPR
ncbi:SDR family NAD(P)-dependent oxidoreductase [Spongiibacter taiwanensis]|uniref:SDR family NAD(P)-dependent oxidoreductase n=1 Tax=Spongiibacter taiwanensis TaxID=1748242 RepID=UPI00203558C0|nr:SDR family NAD(P)-dependent oxidoreductase [Spongiibacter taiwanensis]USA44030.1 SDR family NAD(P)-dependent oxidoreductase [Spongiibacter taiwanensis]